MFSFFSYLFLLLIPILLILIVRLKRRQRVVYSHTFLRSFQDEKVLDYLLRTFQIYYDVLFDLLLALVLAMFLAQIVRFTPRRTAICIDGSYSMIQGDVQTPLERALSLVASGEVSEDRYRLFLLAWDRRHGESKLFRLRELRLPEGADQTTLTGTVRTYADNLQQRYTFHNIDIPTLQKLFDGGFRRVVFITDRFPSSTTNLEIVEVGGAAQSFFYPSSVYYDFSSTGFQILLQRLNYERPIAVLRYEEQLKDYKAIPAPEQRIPGSDLTLIEIKEEGLYRILGPGLDYIYNLEIPRIEATVSGKYSEILADVLPQIVGTDSEALIADLPYDGQTGRRLARKIRRLGTQHYKYVTLIPQNHTPATPLIHPLERSFSQPSFAELPAGISQLPVGSTHLFFQDPERTREGQTPLVYLSYLESDHPSVFSQPGAEELPGWKVSPRHSGITSLVYTRKNDIIPVNLSAQEFFPVSSEGNLVFEPRQVNPLPYFLILLVIYLVKLAFLVRFRSGKPAS